MALTDPRNAGRDVCPRPRSVVTRLVDSRQVLKLSCFLVSVELTSTRLGVYVVYRPRAVVHRQQMSPICVAPFAAF